MIKRVLLVVAICMAIVVAAWGQVVDSRVEVEKGTFAREVGKSEDFSYLSDLREDLSRQIAESEKNVEQITERLNKLGNLPMLQRFLEDKQGALTVAQRSKKVELAEELGNIIARTRDQIREYEDSSAELKKEKSNLAELTQNRSLVEHRIVTLLRDAKDTGTFRWVTSVSFCVLVLFVIAGFYIIAWYKDQIAYTIFAGEKGMQFITLFLIVIAIILFGIMGTLEGKELSALLGGLSGYILGRTSTASTHAEEKSLLEQRAQTVGSQTV